MEVQKIAIIDLDSLAFTAFHPNKDLDEFGNPKRTLDNKKFLYVDKSEEEIKLSCDNLMRSILNNCGATHYLAFIKGKNTISKKLLVDPEYKQDRKETPKQWSFTKQYLIDIWKAQEINDIEVDDAVNIARLKFKNSFICAIDSDLLGLEGTHYNWKKGEWVTSTKEESTLKFWRDMITGTHNNTKGIPKRGKKFADKLFNKLKGEEDKYDQYVLKEYIECFGNEIGRKEYHKNYVCLMILDSYEGMMFQEPISIKDIYARTLGVVGG